MKLLLDTCVWGRATKVLTAAGHDVRWMGETDPDPGDEEVMHKAHDEGCVLIHAWERAIRPDFQRSWKTCWGNLVCLTPTGVRLSGLFLRNLKDH